MDMTGRARPWYRGRVIASAPTGPRALVALVPFMLLAAACGESRTAPPPPNQNLALECVPEGGDEMDGDVVVPDGGATFGCSADEICIQGRCHAACVDDGDCGPREMCAPSGACVRGPGTPDEDATVPTPDAGPTDPCDGVVCDGLEVCHPPTRECVECNEASLLLPRGSAGVCAAAPICDIANGDCVATNPRSCQPCNLAADCMSAGGFAGACTVRQVMDVREQVCLVACADTEPRCPTGLECDDALSLCVPTAGASCTSWLTGTTSASCFTDEDCNARGASAAFFPGACVGETPATVPDAGSATIDGGPGTPGACRQPCGVDAECATVGHTCQGDGFMTFCAPP